MYGWLLLLHILGALDQPTAGEIVVDGVPLTGLDDAAASEFRRRRVGFIFQFFNLVPTMSAWENVALPRLLAADAEAMGAPLSEAEVCARGWALIEALLPTDFVGAVGAGPEACDIYAVDYAVDCATDHATDHATGAPGPSAARPAQRLQLSLMLYRFAGQPPILMISIAPRPAEPERS